MNLPNIFLWLIWFILENRYFGWNALPKSDVELIACGIGFILLAIAIAKAKEE